MISACRYHRQTATLASHSTALSDLQRRVSRGVRGSERLALDGARCKRQCRRSLGKIGSSSMRLLHSRDVLLDSSTGPVRRAAQHLWCLPGELCCAKLPPVSALIAYPSRAEARLQAVVYPLRPPQLRSPRATTSQIPEAAARSCLQSERWWQKAAAETANQLDS